MEAEQVVIPQVKRGRPRKVTEPKEKKPREKKEVSIWRDNPRLYFRMYYHNRPREETSCPHCGNTFDSKRLLKYHLRQSGLCKRIREIKAKQEEKQPDKVD